MTISTVYIGGRYSRRVELAACADDLAQRFGWQRSARWLGGSHEGTRSQVSAIANALCAVSEDDAASTDANIWAREDFADIDAADVVIFFTESPRPSGSGGRHGGRNVEMGYALAGGKHVVTIGPSENIYTALTERYAAWEDFLESEAMRYQNRWHQCGPGYWRRDDGLVWVIERDAKFTATVILQRQPQFAAQVIGTADSLLGAIAISRAEGAVMVPGLLV